MTDHEGGAGSEIRVGPTARRFESAEFRSFWLAQEASSATTDAVLNAEMTLRKALGAAGKGVPLPSGDPCNTAMGVETDSDPRLRKAVDDLRVACLARTDADRRLLVARFDYAERAGIHSAFQLGLPYVRLTGNPAHLRAQLWIDLPGRSDKRRYYARRTLCGVVTDRRYQAWWPKYVSPCAVCPQCQTRELNLDAPDRFEHALRPDKALPRQQRDAQAALEPAGLVRSAGRTTEMVVEPKTTHSRGGRRDEVGAPRDALDPTARSFDVLTYFNPLTALLTYVGVGLLTHDGLLAIGAGVMVFGVFVAALIFDIGRAWAR